MVLRSNSEISYFKYSITVIEMNNSEALCDGTFFASLLKEMSDVVNCFNDCAQKLLELHLASGFRKYFIWFKAKLQGSHIALIQEGKDLVNYAMINAIAIRKILKKYDKVHYSKQGQAFREGPALFEGCYLTFNDGKPFLSCELFDSVKLDIDLTCSISLVISLTCGHIFCYICASSAASVIIVDGLRAANPKSFLYAGVYEGAVHLDELSILLRRSYREYWEQRLEKERVERVRQAKQHWESQCQASIGL
ncbi:hypothetical protein ES288_D11G132700v1 [Gossypium darwinii]|uniref:RING-type E3 ubiquitin transferase n=1 Tax=Gossypium darwinii TaxID=34276 RepID=A0A5D2AJF9_GOSDA|nr:hypothetical protein ES288_D11G132700v1 [Gossypium darwinii]